MYKLPLTGLIALVAVPALAASASPQLATTDPAANSVVKAPVYMVHLMFDAPVDLKSVSVNVTDPRGKPVDAGEPVPMDPENRMLMAIPNKPLAAGRYRVQWRATGPDGKPVSGEYSFTVK